MRYLSICSGIEAATVAWEPLGWTAVGFAEIEPFAAHVLYEHYSSCRPRAMPDPNEPGIEPKHRQERRAAIKAVASLPAQTNGVPNFGDFTTIDPETLGPVDLLVGGTPCQAFSFAGKRQSLADVRGNLTLAYAVLAHGLVRSCGLKNALWENVPGVLSTDDNAFGCFLGALVGADDAVPLPPGAERWPDAGMVAGPRARAAWRLLDAQYFGLAQRRERVFVVVDFGGGADPAAVLFEPQGLQGNTPPRREAGQAVAGTLSACTEGGGGLGTDFDLDGGLHAFGGNNTTGPIDVSTAVNAHGGPNGRQDFESETFIVAPETAATLTRGAESAGKGGYAGRRQEDDVNLIAHTLRGEGFDASEDGTGRGTPLIAVPFDTTQITSKGNYSNPKDGDPCHPLAATAHPPSVAYAIQAGALRENPDSGPDGVGVQSDHAYTLEARAEVQAVVFQPRFARNDRGAPDTVASALTAEAGRTGKGDSAQCVAYQNHGWAVRRLTTVECARLQDFPDFHARIPWRGKPAEQCPDGPQYKVYGNSMAVACMRWLGERFCMFGADRNRAKSELHGVANA